jgi:hypothetical protein
MNYFAKQALNLAKDELIDYAKSQLIKKLIENLNKGDAGIDALFANLKNELNKSTFLRIVREGICVDEKLAEEVKTNLKTKIGEIEFSKELEKMKEPIPGITDEIKVKIEALQETLITRLNKLIDDIITCNTSSTPVSAGGSKKKRRQRKTKKNSHKRSRGRKRHSRK